MGGRSGGGEHEDEDKGGECEGEGEGFTDRNVELQHPDGPQVRGKGKRIQVSGVIIIS